MKHEQGVFRGSGDIELFFQRWEPENPRAVLGIVHGLGDHSGRYANVVSRFVAGGCAVYGFDQRGHGRSPGQRGHVSRWADYRQDARAFLRHICERAPGLPVFWLGHSMGTIVVLDYWLHFQADLRGLIISAPPFDPTGVERSHLVILARLLSAVWPRFSLPLPLDPSATSRDPAAVESLRNDPLAYHRASARWGTEILAARQRVQQHAGDLHVPMLLVHGEADQVSSAEGTRRFFESISSPDKTLRVYPGTLHEPHHDTNHEEVIGDMCRWVLARIP